MPTLMPSLLKYFMTVGAILFVGLIGLNAMMEPGGPGLRMVQDAPKKVVRHDPRASLVERLREEEAAQRASGKAEASPVQAAPKVSPAPAAPVQQPAVTQAAAAAQPQPAVTKAAAAAQPQPVKQAVLEPTAPAKAAAPAAEHQSAPAALTGVATDEETARATRVAHEKAAAEKPRKKRIVREARERTRARPFDETPAARQQDQYYYGQRAPAYAYAQRAPTYAYAPPPRSVFGPFSQAQSSQSGWFGGGWGRGW